MPSGIGNADDNANNFGAMPIGRVGGDTNLVIDSEIVKILTRTGISDAEEILTKVFPGRVKDTNNMAADREPEG